MAFRVFIGTCSSSRYNFQISSKIDIPANSIDSITYTTLLNKVLHSIDNLQISSLDTLYLHSYPLPSKAILDFIIPSLLKIKQNGYTRNIGVSLYTIDQLDLIKEYPFDVLQIPFSVVNQSFLPFLHANKISKKYIIRLRSIFLQGVLLSPPQGLHSEKFSPRFISHIERYFQHLRNINVTPLSMLWKCTVSQPI